MKYLIKHLIIITLLLLYTLAVLINWNGISFEDDIHLVTQSVNFVYGKPIFYNHHSFRLGYIIPQALIIKLLGLHQITFGLFSLISGLLLITAVYFILTSILDKSFAEHASFILATTPWMIAFGSTPNTDLCLALYTFLSLYCAYRCYSAIKAKQLKWSLIWMAASGVLFELSYLTKETGVFIIFLLLILGVFMLIKRDWESVTCVFGLLIVMAFFILLEHVIYYVIFRDFFFRERFSSIIRYYDPFTGAKLVRRLVWGYIPGMMTPLMLNGVLFWFGLAGIGIYIYDKAKCRFKKESLFSLFLLWAFMGYLILNYLPVRLIPFQPILPTTGTRYLFIIFVPMAVFGAYLMKKFKSYHSLIVALIIGVTIIQLLLNKDFFRYQTYIPRAIATYISKGQQGKIVTDKLTRMYLLAFTNYQGKENYEDINDKEKLDENTGQAYIVSLYNERNKGYGIYFVPKGQDSLRNIVEREFGTAILQRSFYGIRQRGVMGRLRHPFTDIPDSEQCAYLWVKP